MVGADTGSQSMAGTAPTPGSCNATDKPGAAASPTTPSTDTPGTMAQTDQTPPPPSNDANTPAATTPTTDAGARREGLKPADLAGVSSDTLIGATVYGADDETLGEIAQILLSKEGSTGTVDAIIIDVGGFLGIGTKPVAVDFKDLQVMTDADGDYYIYSKLTRDQLDAATSYDEAIFEKNRDSMILRSGG